MWSRRVRCHRLASGLQPAACTMRPWLRPTRSSSPGDGRPGPRLARGAGRLLGGPPRLARLARSGRIVGSARQVRRRRDAGGDRMSALDVRELGTVLSVWAHPDDETYLAGGVMASCAEAGQRVVCVSATAGEHGTATRSPGPRTPRALRRGETAAAMAVLGVDDHRFLGFEDGTLATIDSGGRRRRDRRPDRRDPPRHDPDVRTRRDDVPPRPHHDRGVDDDGVGIGRPAGATVVRNDDTRAHCRFAATYEEWGVFMTDERPLGYPAADLAVHHILGGGSPRTEAGRPGGDGVADRRCDRDARSRRVAGHEQ